MTGEQRGRSKPDRRNSGVTRGPSANRSQVDSEFINLELTVEQTTAYRIWREDPEVVFDYWGKLIEEGYRVNTKWDSYNDCCAAFIIPDADGDNGGFILTGRGGTPYRALSEALFKHVEVLRGEWSNSGSKRGRPDDPDF